MFFWVWVVLQAPEQKGERGLQHLHVDSWQALLCVEGCFLLSQETLILETDFLWQLIWAKARLKPLSAAPACTRKKEEEIEGGGSFETHLTHLTECGISSIILSVLQPHIFLLSLFLSLSSPSCCLFLLVHGSCFTAECYLVFQMSTCRSLPGRRSFPVLSSPVRVHEEIWSDGPARAQT